MNPEMWWARTDVTWSWLRHPYDVWFDDGRIRVGDVHRDPYLAFGDWYITSLRVLAQFGLGRDRQPTENTLFDSAPRLEMDALVRTWTSFFSSGEAEFRILLRQGGRLNDTPIPLHAHDENLPVGWKRAFWLESTPSPWRAEAALNSSAPLRFFPLNIWLNGSQDLSIELEVSIELMVRNLAYIELDHLETQLAISLSLPQWHLIDVRDIL